MLTEWESQRLCLLVACGPCAVVDRRTPFDLRRFGAGSTVCRYFLRNKEVLKNAKMGARPSSGQTRCAEAHVPEMQIAITHSVSI